MVLVCYSRWRAVLAIVAPFVALAIPTVSLLISPADFRVRWIDQWVSTGFFGIGLVWFIYALWPSAFRLIAKGPQEVFVDANAITFSSGERYSLNALSTVEILRPWLQHPRVALLFGNDQVTLETAYQSIGGRKSADAIVSEIAKASRG